MKKVIIALVLVALAGCQPSDEEIRADIASKARKDLSFAGIDYTVKNGVVSFTGRCPSEKALNTVKQSISNIHVIKLANYQVAIAPVVLDTLTLVKLQTDSLLAKYPQVVANIRPDGIVLKGAIKADRHAALIKDVRLQIPGNVKDSVTTY